jgi:hypothetical protein
MSNIAQLKERVLTAEARASIFNLWWMLSSLGSPRRWRIRRCADGAVGSSPSG